MHSNEYQHASPEPILNQDFVTQKLPILPNLGYTLEAQTTNPPPKKQQQSLPPKDDTRTSLSY